MLWLLSFLSVAVGTVKNGLSRSLGSKSQRQVHFVNTVTMASAAVFLFLYTLLSGQMRVPSRFTVCFAALYAVFSLLSQIALMNAMVLGSVAFSSLMFSCGFVPSTLLGILFFHEPVAAGQIIAVLVLVAAIWLSMSQKAGKSLFSLRWFLFAFTAFACAGLVGFLQKYYQKSEYRTELPLMLLIDFLLSAVVSFFLFRRSAQKSETTDLSKSFWCRCFILGGAMAFQNVNNTYLAGKLPSVIFFPLLNGGIIICTAVASSFLFKEKLTPIQKISLGVAVGAMAAVGLFSL